MTAKEARSRSRRGRWMAWVALAGFLASLAFRIWMVVNDCPVGPLPDFLIAIGSGTGFTILGVLIVAARPGNRIGWYCLVAGLSFLLLDIADDYVGCALDGRFSLSAVPVVAWLNYVAGYPLVVSVFILLPFLFPDGRFHSARWRRLAILSLAAIGLAVAIMATLPGPLGHNGLGSSFPVDNPLGLSFLPQSLGPFILIAGPVLAIAGTVAAILSFVVRWRDSRGDTRQQLKWMAYFLVTAVGIHVVGFELLGGLFYPAIFDTPLYTGILLIDFLGFPLVIGIAVFKYRLYDIDLIIRRTLLYGLLSALLSLIYFASVTILQSAVTVVTSQQSPIIIVLSTLLIAALFTPLRRRVQDLIDRRFFRQKYNAQQVLARFAQTARDEVDLDQLTVTLLQVVNETVQPASAAVWLAPYERSRRNADV